MLEALPDVADVSPVGGLLTILGGWISLSVSRVVGAVRQKWDNDARLRVQIANAQIRSIDRLATGILALAREHQPAELRDTVPLDVDRDAIVRPIDRDYSGPISIG